MTAGLGAALLGVGAGQLVGGWINPAAAPLSAVASAVIDATPAAVKDWAIATFGTNDKLALIVGILVLLALIGALAGTVSGSGGPRSGRRRIGYGLVALMTVSGIAAALTRPAAGAWDVLPSLAAGAASWGALAWLFADRPAGVARPGLPRRRLFLGGLGLAASGGVLGALSRAAPGAEPVPPPSLPAPSSTPATIGGSLDVTVPGISPLRTPIDDFYRIDIAVALPRIPPEDWKLTIDGLVERPLTLTWDELLAGPLVERDITLTCVSNEIGGPLCGSTRWLGLPVADLLARVGPLPEADMVLSFAPDGFSASTPLPVMLDGRDAMIAIAMDGRPLTQLHGAPARLLTPGLYGFVGATKWLQRLKVTRFDADQAYWTTRGWSDHGPVKTACRIDTPRGSVRAGDVAIGGVAWATHRGVSKVEVQIDQGPWQAARLSDDLGLDYWRQWVLPWAATAGHHSIAARAYDGAGVVQPAEVRPVAPDGPTGYHRVSVEVG